MIGVFVSSTFRDLEAERQQLLDRLDGALDGVGMEKFVPFGKSSQETAIDELKKSDAVIFLVSPYYGSFIEKCDIQDCKAECGVNDRSEKISYTHCEFKIAQVENIPYLTYVVDKHWNIVNELNKMESLEWDIIRENNIFDGLSNKEIKHYFEVAERVLDFKNEVNTRLSPRIKDVDDIEAISEHLGQNIVSLYSEGKIDLMDFCGRRKELKELLDKMDESVEVYGVGGIGKTTLIHVALLIQKLKGKKIISVGTMQSYSTGSGYRPFKDKCGDTQNEIVGEKISMSDIFVALSVEMIPEGTREKIKAVSDMLVSENIILFIDDFHLADNEVKELVKVSGNIVLSSKKKIGVSRNEVPLSGIDEEDRDKLIDLITKNKRVELSDTAKEKIKRIAEGNPVSTEILVKNYERIDFEEIEDYKKKGLDLSNPDDAEEFYERVVKEVLSEEAFELLKNISLLNTEMEGNLDRKALKKTYPANFDEIFGELVDTDMLDKKAEGIYQFTYRHVQEAISEDDRKRHEKAIEYYRNKEQTNDTPVEVLYHLSKYYPDIKLIDLFISLSNILKPVHYGFKRLIDVGEILRTFFEKNDKAKLSGTLGILYRNLNRFEEAEKAYNETFKIYKKLADKSPDVYLPCVATTQNNLANLYRDLKRFEEAEKACNDALEIYIKFSDKSPDAYLPNVAMAQNNLACIYGNLKKFEEAEKACNDALEIYIKLADKSPDAYLPNVAMAQNNLANSYSDLNKFKKAEKAYNEALEIFKKITNKSLDNNLPDVASIQNNLAILYRNLKKFEEAEKAYNDALEIYIKLADKSPDAYLPNVAMIQNNLANLYRDLNRFDKVEKAYNEALEIYIKLAEKSPDAYMPDLLKIQINIRKFQDRIRNINS